MQLRPEIEQEKPEKKKKKQSRRIKKFRTASGSYEEVIVYEDEETAVGGSPPGIPGGSPVFQAPCRASERHAYEKGESPMSVEQGKFSWGQSSLPPELVETVPGKLGSKVQLKSSSGVPPQSPPGWASFGTSVPSPKPTSVNLGASKPPAVVGRLPSLDAKIKNLKEKLGATQKRIQHLELKKAKYGIDFPDSDALKLEEAIGDAKKFALETKVLERERELQKQYETELVAAAPIHMALSIAQKGHSTFIDTLAMCERIMPSLFNDHSLLLGYSGGMLARQFQARADLESQKSGQQISAKALIEDEIKELEGLASYHTDSLLLQYLEASLHEAEKALESSQQPASFSPVPADPIAQALPQLPDSGGGHGICFQINEKRRLKITVLNQPPTGGQGESASIYESYSETGTMVRVVYNYWKVWSSGKFNFSEDTELFGDLGKLSDACSRKIKLCRDEIAGYRLPYCIMFLSAFGEHEQSDGLHIPICLALQSTVMEKDQRVLRAEDVQNKSISHLVFVELFNREMLGSGWLNREWLLDLDKFLMTLLPPETPIILTQEYSYPAQGDDKSEVSD